MFPLAWTFAQQEALSDLVVARSSAYFGGNPQPFKHAFDFFYFIQLGIFLRVSLTNYIVIVSLDLIMSRKTSWMCFFSSSASNPL